MFLFLKTKIKIHYIFKDKKNLFNLNLKKLNYQTYELEDK
jgi:hypothetical protein